MTLIDEDGLIGVTYGEERVFVTVRRLNRYEVIEIRCLSGVV